MKVIENHIANARAIYEEALSLEKTMLSAANLLTPFSQQTEQKNFPRYLASTSTALRNLPMSNFGINYPNLSAVMGTGELGTTGYNRICTAVYVLGDLVKRLEACKFMPKTDEDRATLQDMAKRVCSNVAVCRMAVFNLFDGVNTVYLAVDEHCTANGITVYDLYEDLEETFKIVGGGVYGYEEQSDYYIELSDAIPTLLTEMEECHFPLTDEVCKMFLAGYLSLSQLTARVEEHKKRSTSIDVDGITPLNMLDKLELK